MWERQSKSITVVRLIVVQHKCSYCLSLSCLICLKIYYIRMKLKSIAKLYRQLTNHLTELKYLDTAMRFMMKL
jgi:hypothetical protein